MDPVSTMGKKVKMGKKKKKARPYRGDDNSLDNRIITFRSLTLFLYPTSQNLLNNLHQFWDGKKTKKSGSTCSNFSFLTYKLPIRNSVTLFEMAR